MSGTLRTIITALLVTAAAATAASAPRLQALQRIPEWSLDPAPVTRIVLSGRDRRVLAARLGDGRIAMSYKGTLEMYSAAGAAVSDIVRNGSAFWFERFYVTPGDSIVGIGYEAKHVWDSNGKHIRSERFEPRETQQGWVLPSGAFIGAEPHMTLGSRGYFWRQAYDYFYTPPSRSSRATRKPILLGTYALPIAIARAPYAVLTATVETADGLIVANGMQPYLRVFSRDGSVKRVIRINRRTEKVTERELRAFRDLEVLRAGSVIESFQLREGLETSPHGINKPFYEDVTADSDGNIWLQDYRVDPSTPQRWTVLSSTGVELARITLPPSFEISQIDHGFVTGVDRLDKTTQAVSVFRLVK